MKFKDVIESNLKRSKRHTLISAPGELCSCSWIISLRQTDYFPLHRSRPQLIREKIVFVPKILSLLSYKYLGSIDL